MTRSLQTCSHVSLMARWVVELANDHRYLVNEKFKVAMAFIDKLAQCHEHGWYDPRDEWACTLAASIMAHLKDKQLYYSQIENQ